MARKYLHNMPFFVQVAIIFRCLACSLLEMCSSAPSMTLLTENILMESSVAELVTFCFGPRGPGLQGEAVKVE
jgi:hypothetical protein